MLIGYNNDVEYRGKEFHIQTEDHGKSTAKIESQIFHQGQILDTEIVSYDSVLDEDAPEEKIEAKLQSLLEATHKGLYKRLVGGEYDEMVGLDPVEEEEPEEVPEDFEPSQDRVPTAAKQIEEEGEEAFQQFHENEAQKHVDLDDLKSHLADKDDGDEEEADEEEPAAAEASDATADEGSAETMQNIDPTIEEASPATVEQQSPFDDDKSEAEESPDASGVDLKTSEAEADGAAVIESRPSAPPDDSGAPETAPGKSDAPETAPGKSDVQSERSGTGNKSSGTVPSPSTSTTSRGELPETGVQAWNGCREPDESFSIVELVESFLAE